MQFAKAEDGIPLVADDAQRDALFPAPATNQRVYNIATATIERYNGGWVADMSNVSAGAMTALQASINAAVAQIDAALAGLAGAQPLIDATRPGGTRTVPTLAAYLLNNAAYNVRDYGAVGDGVTDDSAAVALAGAAAHAAGGALIRFPKGTYKISTNTTGTSDVSWVFEAGALLSIDVGKTVTINGQVLALYGNCNSGAGTVVYGHQVNFFANQYGFGFGNKVPSNTDDFIHIQRDVDIATALVIKNDNDTANCEAAIHIFGGSSGNGSDLQLRAQSVAMGKLVNIVAQSNLAFSIIQVSNAPLNLYANNKIQFSIAPDAGAGTNLIEVHGSGVGSAPRFTATGADATISFALDTKGAGALLLRTAAGADLQAAVIATAGATRYVTLTGSNGGSPQVGSSAGPLRLQPATDIQWGVGLVGLGGGAAPVLGTIGGAGPAVAAQNAWMRVMDAGGVLFWVPAWK